MNDIEQALKELPLKVPSSKLDERIFSELSDIKQNKKKAFTFPAWVHYAISTVAALFIINFFLPKNNLKLQPTVAQPAIELNTSPSLPTTEKRFIGTPIIVKNQAFQPIIEEKIIHREWNDSQQKIHIEINRPQHEVKFISLPID